MAPNGLRIDSKRGSFSPSSSAGLGHSLSNISRGIPDDRSHGNRSNNSMDRLLILSSSSASSPSEGIVSQLVLRGPDGRLLLMVDESNVHLAIDRLRVNSKYQSFVCLCFFSEEEEN